MSITILSMVSADLVIQVDLALADLARVDLVLDPAVLVLVLILDQLVLVPADLVSVLILDRLVPALLLDRVLQSVLVLASVLTLDLTALAAFGVQYRFAKDNIQAQLGIIHSFHAQSTTGTGMQFKL
jgi:hypothetical protein